MSHEELIGVETDIETEEDKQTARLDASIARMEAKERACGTHELGPLSRRNKRWATGHGYRWECSKCHKLFKRKSSPRGPWSLHLSKAEQERVAAVPAERLRECAFHEVGHAVTAHALGRRAHNQLAITIIPGNGFFGRVRGAGASLNRSAEVKRPFKTRRQNVIRNFAISLAGGMAEFRLTGDQRVSAVGMLGDCLSIFDILTVNPQDHTEVTRALEIAREQRLSFRDALQKITDERQSLANPEVRVLCQVVIALAFADDTIAALKRLPPDVAMQYAGSSQFRILAESADVARGILTKNWETVTALATHLISVKKMSGVQLTAFLESRVI